MHSTLFVMKTATKYSIKNLMEKCKDPKCEFSRRWGKCVQPNSYIEALAWCKRNNITAKQCKQDYNSATAKLIACKRYRERMNIQESPQVQEDNHDHHPFVNDVYLDTSEVREFRNKTAAKKISQFVMNTVLKRAETLENRIKYYNSIQYVLKNVPYYNCIQPIQYVKNGVTYDAFELDTTLKLTKQIGSRSNYGAVFQTATRNSILTLTSKLMPVNRTNKQEVILNTTVTTLIIRKMSKHFLMSYRVFKCMQKNNDNVMPRLIKNKEYYVNLNELAHGDLKMLCNNDEILRNDDYMYNIMMQCFIAIFTFHKLGYSHNDCHWGNFLYHLTKYTTNGYYHYEIHGKSYYLKNCIHNMMIYDYGFAKSKRNTEHKRRCIADYLRVIQAFRKHIYGGWIHSYNLPNIPVSLYMNQMNQIIDNAMNIQLDEDNLFMNYIIPHMLSCPISNIFMENIPTSTIINSSPFIIDNRILAGIVPINPMSSSLADS